MRAELVLMGRRVDMAVRARRRTLVVLIYVAFAVLFTAAWFIDRWHTTGTYLYWGAMLACRLFLGGYYRGGLVKPFNDRVRRERPTPHPFLALGLRIYQPAQPDDDRLLLNDERELQQRNLAHYKAYQVIGMALLVPWFIAYLRMLRPQWWSGMTVSLDQLFYALTLIILLLVFTLPQAILLWTEPDMETDFRNP